MSLFFYRNLPFKFFLPFLFSKRVSGKILIIPKQLENMMCLVARTGMQLQRYDDDGCRQVVGYVRACMHRIPYLVYFLSLRSGDIFFFSLYSQL
ncbi:putative hydrolase [Medicago truncatula]|uniref:Putative hydrolase n=1 Tax=Medicago truncatula TaxID=3880 RepID=G7LE81_MEDTR|nr:hypothetical protein MTR_8g107500 [Medicago truncatula]RHN43938.1 putative hydrolase [Medicago truncatula]